MKNLTHYFTESVKATGNDNSTSSRRVNNNTSDKINLSVASIVNNNEENNKTQSSTKTIEKKKRGRVKIKISQVNNPKDARCNIVESKNDLVDKTPSPFTAPASQSLSNKQKIISPDETPKRSTSNTVVKTAASTKIKSQCKIKSTSLDVSHDGDENNISESLDSSIETIFDARPRAKQEESNAFKLLMTRNKLPVQPVKSKGNNNNLVVHKEDDDFAVEMETPAAKTKTKPTGAGLLNKKEYKNTKRKLIPEDEQQHEDNSCHVKSENHGKVVKKPKKEEEIKSPMSQLQNQKTSMSSLHNYFSKLTSEEREKERQLAVSKVVVKAEIHGPAGAVNIVPTKILTKPKSNARITKLKTRKVLATIDDIQVLRSETPSPPPVQIQDDNKINVPIISTAEEQQQQQQQRQKPKWSLRINLSESTNEDTPEPIEDRIDEELLPTPKTKANKRKKKDSLKSIENDLQKERQESQAKRLKMMKCSQGKINEKVSKVDPVAMIQDKKVTDSVTENKKEVHVEEEKEIEEIIIAATNDTNNKLIKDKVVPQEKLAPLFIKRTKPDPAAAEARRRFLSSWPSENSSKKTSKKPPIFNGISILPFPLISHVHQVQKIQTENINTKFKFPIKKKFVYIPEIDVNNFKSLRNINEESKFTTSSTTTTTTVEKSKKIIDVEEKILQEIETRCEDARNLWQAISKVNDQNCNSNNKNNSIKKRGRKRKSQEIQQHVTVAATVKDTNIIWIQKYRPLSASQIVGNEDAAEKLKNWLDAWKKPVQAEVDYSSGEEFYSSDNSRMDLINTNQVAVLLGPHGCGKTASVYAVAEELGYTILEVNASSKRPGKKILKDFEEATQSHRIKKSDVTTLGQSLLTEKPSKVPQNSLILVEDVDLIFDEDEGFISAINQLASNTKRPIVMTCRDTCLHLPKVAPQQMKIYFNSSTGKRCSSLLELLTLAETGSRLPTECIDKLLVDGDLRKAILQLQYLLAISNNISSNLPSVPSDFDKTFWQDVRNFLYKPAIKMDKKKLKKKNGDKNSEPVIMINKSSIMENLVNDLDTMSMISSLVEINDTTLSIKKLKFEPSLSLAENSNLYSRNEIQSNEIASWLKSRIFSKHLEGEFSGLESQNSNSNQISLVKKELNVGVDFALSQITTFNLDGQGIALDYLPAVRTICRAEDIKASSNSKRGNRFFHYLSNFRIPTASIKPNILSAACKMMLDKDNSC